MKDVVISTLAPATIFTGTFDAVLFQPNWVIMLTDVPDKRTGYSWANTNVQKVTVSPAGIVYPGDAVLGLGPKKVTIDFLGAPATVILNNVESADVVNGWLYIIRAVLVPPLTGDEYAFVFAYSPSVIDNAIVEPST